MAVMTVPLELTEHITSLVKQVRDDFANSRINAIPVSVAGLQDHTKRFLDIKDNMRTDWREKSPMFRFWDDYLIMVDILLLFIRAERTGNWELHKASLAAMMPYFFAYDRHNYARYGTVYMSHMETLLQTAPEVHQHFMSGEFVVARSERKFAQVSVDLALEPLQHITKSSECPV